MRSATEIEKFAGCLRELKERSGRSYGVLARRLHVSTSTLHRYCNGDAVPADYAPIERLARLCAATQEELVELHRHWLLADAARRTNSARGNATRGAGSSGSTDCANSGREAQPPQAKGSGEPRNPGSAASTVSAASAAGAGSAKGAGPSPEPDPPQEPSHAASPGTPQPPSVPATPGTPTPMPTPSPTPDTSSTPTPSPTPQPPHPRRSWRGPAHRLPARLPGRAAVWAAAGALLAATIIGVAAGSSPGDAGKGAGEDTGAGYANAPVSPPPTGPDARAEGPLAEPDAAAGKNRERGHGDEAEKGSEDEAEGADRKGAGAQGSDEGAGGRQREPTADGRHGGQSPGGAARESAAPRPGGAGQDEGPDSGAGNGANDGARAPLSVNTRSHVWEYGCDHRYLINKSPTEVAPPPVEQDAPGWARAHNAVHGGTTIVETTVTGQSSNAVVLRGLQVRVVGRQAPLAWSSFAMDNGCGGALTPREFSVNLDAARPLAKPTDGYDGEHALPAVRFPYRVSATDPEVLRINARTVQCDCQWYLELDWTSGDRHGTVRIDDAGQPFRTSSLKGRPQYGYWSAEGAWTGDGT
ncbi:helix-turn-helix domain-containing protein [Streptomyces zagrosensis]|uniref:Plasmid maintenance system antidote protein VapI n=1 Tax=Streptomyces zagrosensis TaxID=1042984 RepID=A0A7W9QBW7_9ACTN|nr:helix-turn-helix domain-containing protein [Streptomyces zagrosensis]MBB5937281.1 plasmid maintenance system antidote protein VapI [Streptomyces zagrosensis]